MAVTHLSLDNICYGEEPSTPRGNGAAWGHQSDPWGKMKEGPSTPRGNGGAWGKQPEPWGKAKEWPTTMGGNAGQWVPQPSSSGRREEQLDARKGWRTPDPSPLRSGIMNYAGYGPFSMAEEKGIMTNSPRRGRNDLASQGGASRSASPAWARIRTPSPDDFGFQFPQQERRPMMAPYFPPQEPLQPPPLLRRKEEQPPEGTKTIQLESFLYQSCTRKASGQQAAYAPPQAAYAPPPPPVPAPVGFVRWPKGAPPPRTPPGAAPRFATAPWSDMRDDVTETAQAPCAAFAGGERVVSKGSVGHPHSCSEACKYVFKKRGCKDGENCDRCHLCDWKRHSTLKEGTKRFGHVAAQQP